MPINTACTKCGKSWRVPMDQGGKRVQCLECKGAFVVKGDSDDYRNDPDRARSRFDDEDEWEDEEEEQPSSGGGYVLYFVGAGVLALLLLLVLGGGVAAWVLMGRGQQPVAVNNQPKGQNDPIKDDNRPKDGEKPVEVVREDPPPRDVPSALSALSKADADRKRQGLEFLLTAEIDADRRNQVELALEALMDDATFGDLATRALKRWAPDNEVPRQIRRLRSSSPEVYESAMAALSKSDDDRALTALGGQLEAPGRTAAAAKHLKSMGVKGEKAVLPHLNHPQVQVREAAREVLLGIGTSQDDQVEQCLVDLGRSKGRKFADKQRMAAAIELLASMTPGKNEEQNRKVAKVFEEGLSAKGLGGQVALDAMEKWATKDQVPALVEMLKQPNQKEKATVILMRFSDDERLIPLFAEALAYPQYREAAIKALKGFGEKAEDTLQLLLDLSYPNADARGLALLLVAEFGTSKSLPALNKLKNKLKLNTPQWKAVDAVIRQIQNREKKKEKEAPKDKDK